MVFNGTDLCFCCKHCDVYGLIPGIHLFIWTPQVVWCMSISFGTLYLNVVQLDWVQVPTVQSGAALWPIKKGWGDISRHHTVGFLLGAVRAPAKAS